MPPNPTKPPPKRKAPAFKPPRSISKPKPTTAPQRRKSAPAKHHPLDSPSSSEVDQDPSPMEIGSSDDDDIDDDEAGENVAAAPAPQSVAEDDPPPTIPPKLLTKLLHHHFTDEKTRMGKDANALVGKYMETFVREALARAALERESAEGREVGPGFLEVEDLEKLAPQLLLDF